jgi:hypothetical protein
MKHTSPDPVTFVNNLVTGNEAYDSGGGMVLHGSAVMANNTLADNTASAYGGGIYFAGNDELFWIRNAVSWNNAAAWGPAMALMGSSDEVDIAFSDVDGGRRAVYIDHPSNLLTWGPGMLDADPLFADPSADDYHILFTSPCRDTGDNAAPALPAADFEGDPRPWNGVADMGADEFYPHLYYTGNATPGGDVELKFIGLPGDNINGLIIGINIFDPPLPCDYGLWYMNDPMQIITGLGTISTNGIAVIPGTLHPSIPAPSTIYLQAAIDLKLTGLCTVNVQ